MSHLPKKNCTVVILVDFQTISIHCYEVLNPTFQGLPLLTITMAIDVLDLWRQEERYGGAVCRPYLHKVGGPQGYFLITRFNCLKFFFFSVAKATRHSQISVRSSVSLSGKYSTWTWTQSNRQRSDFYI